MILTITKIIDLLKRSLIFGSLLVGYFILHKQLRGITLWSSQIIIYFFISGTYEGKQTKDKKKIFEKKIINFNFLSDFVRKVFWIFLLKVFWKIFGRCTGETQGTLKGEVSLYG